MDDSNEKNQISIKAQINSSVNFYIFKNSCRVELPPTNSFIHSGYFYSASSSPLLLRGAPDTARIPCRSFTSKRLMQLRVKDLPKVPTLRLERNSDPRPFWRTATKLPMSHY